MPGVSISFLFSFALKAAKRFAVSAVSSASHAKSISLTEARQTPPMTGSRQSHLAREIRLPYIVEPTRAAKAGSVALTILRGGWGMDEVWRVPIVGQGHKPDGSQTTPHAINLNGVCRPCRCSRARRAGGTHGK